MMSKCNLKPEQCVSFSYPRSNYACAHRYLEQRRIRVKYVRDLKFEPIEQRWIDLDPLLDRGRFLVFCIDLDSGTEKKFYWNAMSDVQEIASAETLPGMEYCVVEQRRVSFASQVCGEAVAFSLGRKDGVVCSIMRSKKVG